MFDQPRAFTVLFATETGTAAVLAEFAAAAAHRIGMPSRLIDMATYNTTRLVFERDVLVITSTHGDGDPPQTAADFFDFIDETPGPLPGLRYAVLALGDSGYDAFCAAGRRIDRRLEELGALRLLPRRDIDVDELKLAREWLTTTVGLFAETAMARRNS